MAKKVLDKNEACLSCRKRKTKCDVRIFVLSSRRIRLVFFELTSFVKGIRPTCGTCSRLEKKCVFPIKDLKDKLSNKPRSINKKGESWFEISGEKFVLTFSLRECEIDNEKDFHFS